MELYGGPGCDNHSPAEQEGRSVYLHIRAKVQAIIEMDARPGGMSLMIITRYWLVPFTMRTNLCREA
jgi:hypothetical protein